MRTSKQLLLNFLAAALCVTADASVAQTSTREDTPTEVARGEYLARVGDCASCHTPTGGAAFSGGASLQSPLGPIYAPNITADKETGIGNWSDDDFYRALHEGVGKGGERLYPAMPYPHYTKVTRDDALAIKAYLFSLPSVHKENKVTKLPFPFDIRTGLAVWNEAFFKPGVFEPDPNKSAEYNRGAYLVEGLAHCGDCHTPRGYMLEPLSALAYSGGVIDNWYASNITSSKDRGIGRWSADELFQYLKTGFYKDRAPVVGPMNQVVHASLSHLTDADLHAIVAYVRNIKPVEDYKATPGPALTGPHSAGETAYLAHCAFCHGRDGKGRPGVYPALAGNDVVRGKGPETVIRVVLGGLLARGSFASMPAVGQEMTNQEIVDAVNYVRNAWGNEAPANANDRLVDDIRRDTYGLLAMRPSANDQADPCRSVDDATPIMLMNDPQILTIIGKTDAVNMLHSVRSAIARLRQIAPNAGQAETVNGLTQAYCKVEAASGQPTLKSRLLLSHFAEIVYAELLTSPLKAITPKTKGPQPQTQGSQRPAKTSAAQRDRRHHLKH